MEAEQAGGESFTPVPAPALGLPDPGWYLLYSVLSRAPRAETFAEG